MSNQLPFIEEFELLKALKVDLQDSVGVLGVYLINGLIPLIVILQLSELWKLRRVGDENRAEIVLTINDALTVRLDHLKSWWFENYNEIWLRHLLLYVFPIETMYQRD